MTEQIEVKLNLYQKIHAVMKDVQYLNKDDKIEFNKTKYKAISEEKVTSTIRKALLEYGLVIMPVEQEHFREGTLSTVNTKYKIVDIETGQFEIIVSSGTGVDTQDKGVGKAMTYSYKYLLLRTFAIPTGEDPDKISSAELDEKMKGISTTTGKKTTGDSDNLATEKQLNLIDGMLSKKVNVKYSKEQLYKSLKEKMNTTNEIEKWSKQEASKAIEILQNGKQKQGA